MCANSACALGWKEREEVPLAIKVLFIENSIIYYYCMFVCDVCLGEFSLSVMPLPTKPSRHHWGKLKTIAKVNKSQFDFSFHSTLVI